jgi:hypothetical protein
MIAPRSLSLFSLLLITISSSWADCASGYNQKTISIAHHVVSRPCVPNGKVVVTAPGSIAAGAALAGWIQESHDSVYGASAPLPVDARAVMTQWGVAADVLDRARYKFGDNVVANLALILNATGDINAITLIDVIVFHNTDAAQDLGSWAHELVHVRQDEQQGVVDFALGYAANYAAYENPAYNEQGRFYTWLARHCYCCRSR